MAQWDVAVVGGGPAGLAAAAVVAGAGLSCLLLDRMGGGGELMNLGALHDCPDLPAGSTGPDLAAQLLEAAIGAGAELAAGEVTALASLGEAWSLATAAETHAARAVILACGLAPGRLGLAEEAGFEGRGLSHCAACDGPLYRGQPVVVAGADRWAVQEAVDLAATASAVTLVTGGEPVPAVPDVAVLHGTVAALEGEAGLEAVVVRQAGGGTRRLPARAIFVQCGRRPALGFAPAALARAADGRVPVDAALRCALPRLFAAGDARAGGAALIRAALADGQRAGQAAARALRPLGSATE